jgi:radical SAM superfamily enzyme YgiQ (UPF0313 family)
MKALLVYPLFPRTYWGQEYTHRITGARAVLPPLGLLTVAALLPRTWELRLVDMNVEPLAEADLIWADVVMISAMLIQRDSFHEVVRRAHALGRKVVAGGPYVTTDPEAAPDVDHLVLGEAEETLPQLALALEAGNAPRRTEATERPDVTKAPVPRFDLARMDRYTTAGVQFSRGCPFNCEFCDIIEIFGRVPRTKPPEQLCAELDALHATGFRGAVFLVDDNFIGNKVAARKMLARLGEWSRARRFPFDFFTEASVNLAGDDVLIDGMVSAGFSAVFLGIETPSKDALLETQKRQNVHSDLRQSVEKLTRRGLNVMAGFIVGFDADDETIFERQRDFIASAPIPMAMIGILTALPGTQLSRRLAKEGRLHTRAVGDTAYRPNFVTRMPEATLVAGYRRLLAELYAPRAYFDRAFRLLELKRNAPYAVYRRPLGFALPAFARSLWLQGVRSSYRNEYWRFLAKVLVRTPGRFFEAVPMAVVGEHMIRYTNEDILPRLSDVLPPPDLVPATPPPLTALRSLTHAGGLDFRAEG